MVAYRGRCWVMGNAFASIVFVILAAALFGAAPVVAADPFPNQPGALSEQEIQAAQDAMTPMLGSEPRLPLAASGRRIPGHTLPSYVVFAAPPARKSGRVMTQRRVICNFFGTAGPWRCSAPHDALHLDANGIKHVLVPQVLEGSLEDAEAVEIADYLYSECFATQFKGLDEARDVTSFNALPIHTIMKRPGPAYSVFTGMWPDEDIYSLIGSVKPADGCRYKIVNVTFGKRDWEKQLAEKRRKEEETAALAEQNRLAQEAAVRESTKVPEIRPTYQGLKPDELMIFGLVLGVTTVYFLGPFLVVMLLVWLIWGITRIYKPGLSLEWPLAISGFALIAFVAHLIM